MQDQTPSQEQDPRLLVVLGTLLGFASISADLYLPALPRMAEALGAEQSALELTVSGYLVGFSAGQLLWGPISDRYGRRSPVAVGLVIFVLGAAGCALSTTAGQLILWRVVQALGGSAGVVLARAMVRDLYSRDRAARVLSTLMTVMAVAPLVGPTVGGQILRVADWPAIFWTLVAIGLATLLALTTIPETLPRDRRTAEPMGQALAGYGELLGNHRLMGYAAAGGFYFVGVFAYVAGTPFAFISYHGLSPQLYGLIFAAGIVGPMVTNLVNSRLVMRVGSDWMLWVGSLGAAASGLLVALVAGTGLGGIGGLAGALFLFVAMNGFINANMVSGALASVLGRVGAASALVGAIQYGGGVLGSALVGAFADGTPWPLGWVVALSGLGTLASALLALRSRHS
jgi:DHA1 family bicyclomycin/chloramphenicol resistance-like MFS transporter